VNGLHLQDPGWLALLLLLPLLVAWRHRRRAYGELTYSSLPRGAGGAWRLHLPFYARLSALALLIAAAARPQLGFAREQDLTEGIDIQVVLDVSSSMAAKDFQPQNRLQVAKDVTREFVARRTGDRIGLIVFAAQALTRSPLTGDQRMLHQLVDSIELYTLPDGTAIGLALAAAAARLKDSAAESRVAVLLTDGVNNAGAVDPDSAAAICEGLGIKVYTVGVGTTGKVLVAKTFRDRFGRLQTRDELMDVEVDEELLKGIAERTGGRFFRATDPDSLRRIFAEIDELEKTQLRVERYVRYRETFQPLVQAALALLLAPLALAGLGLTAEP
jgi:Ca-activated chloride channel family protein